MLHAIESINSLRREELARVFSRYGERFKGADVLEIGSGSGVQLKAIQRLARSAKGIDVCNGNYSQHRIIDVIDYDGLNIPFPDSSFDLIFSSHVLEHLIDEPQLYKEMARVLRPGGTAIHVVPTITWRLWSSIVHYPDVAVRIASKFLPKKNNGAAAPTIRQHHMSMMERIRYTLLPCRHGEKGNWITEMYWLHPAIWKRRIEGNGWKVNSVANMGLWCSGYFLLGDRLSIRARSKLARMLGSCAVVIETSPNY
ncbi:MAG TPA: methyltransferase domain-containing protein [Candidatus Angelobacter sp.]|nr:methyltransferase domain-containing protein [Candidatus Angelobacter sp.]